jgi:DNA-binding beta-propeller fold protein YncE
MKLFPLALITVFIAACGAADSHDLSPGTINEDTPDPIIARQKPLRTRLQIQAVEEIRVAPPSSGDPLWTRRFGGTGMDMGVSIATNARGEIYVLGQFSGVMDTGLDTRHHSAGLEDIFLLKLDMNGNPLWSKSFGGDSHDYADHVVIDDSGDVFITGSFMDEISLGGKKHRCKGVHDIFVAKLDPEGNYIWSKAYGDEQDQICLRPLPTRDGGVFLAGYFRGVVNLGKKPHRSYPDKAAFVGRLDKTGKRVWSEQFGHIYDYAKPGMALAKNGDLVYGGGSDPTREFTGRPFKRVDRMMDLGVVVARYDSAGKRLWRSRFGAGSDNLHTEVALGPYGDIILAGSFGGTMNFGGEEMDAGSRADIFVAALKPDGGHLWSRQFGGGRYQYISGLAVDQQGNTYLAGQFLDGGLTFGGDPMTSNTSDGSFLAKLDREGQHLWSRSLEGDSLRFPGGITLTPDGGLLVVGSFSGSIDLGNEKIASLGSHDVFVAKIRH